MSRLTAREYGENILAALQEDSEYAWYTKESEPKLAQYAAKSIRYGDLESRCMCGELSISDTFILQAVISLGFCTVEMVQDMLTFLSRGHENTHLTVLSREQLAARLTVMTKMSLVFCFDYRFGTVKHTMYSITVPGVQYWTHASMKRVQMVDAMLNMVPAMDKMRKLACSYVGIKYAIALGEKCRELKTNETINIGRNYGKQTIYGRMYCKIDEKRYLTYIEPLYFNFDERLLTSAENSNNLITRLQELRRHMIFDMNTKIKDSNGNATNEPAYQEVRLIAVLENKDSLVQAVSLIYREMPEILSEIWFTTPRVIGSLKDPLHSFLKVKVKSVDSATGALDYVAGMAQHTDLLDTI